MALTATLDMTKKPPTLTVVSDRREGSVTTGGETANFLWPVVITDPSGHPWAVQSDDGTTAVYT